MDIATILGIICGFTFITIAITLHGTLTDQAWSPRWCDYFLVDPAWLPAVVCGSTTVGTGTSTDTNTSVQSGETKEKSPTTGTSTDKSANTGSSNSTTPNSTIGSSASTPGAASSLDAGVDNPASAPPSTKSTDTKSNEPNNPK